MHVFDIEANGLNPDKIHCLATGGKATTSYDNMRKFLAKADVLIGHNIICYDVPVLEKLLGIEIKAKLVDTLALSWYLYPERPRHGLDEWGEEFGIPKPVVEDWDNLSPEEYKHRCKEDVKINTRLWEKQWKYLLKMYETEEDAWRLIDYLSFKMKCAADQMKLRWKLDVERCTRVLKELEEAKEAKVKELFEAMPKVPVMASKKKPTKLYLKGQFNKLSVAGESWFALLEREGLPRDYDGVVEYVKDWKDPNPNSHDQIKRWLDSLGWEPITFKYDRNKITGDVRKIPQVQKDKTKGGGLCDSVKLLYAKEPKLEILNGLSVITHRISILTGFLANVDGDGYVRAEVQGLTNTLRFKHRVLVNLPGVDKPYGDDIRGCLVAPEGYELCGSDMSSLEDRTKQHYMWDYDPDYVKEMMTPDFDPHLDLAQFAGELTPLQVAMHKAKEEDHGGVRKIYKGVNYACVYGAGGATVARTAGVPLHKGEKLVEAYWKRNWSVKKIAEDQIVRTIGGKKWLFNPVSRLWYSLRHDKDRFSTLNQGTGVWCFDMWVKEVKGRGMPIIGQFHDEIIGLVKVGRRKQVTKILKDCIGVVNEQLKLNRELDCSVEFGENYAKIH